MIVVLSISGLLLVTLVIGRITLSIQFSKDVKALFAGSKTTGDKIFLQRQLSGLPEPVQRYFNLVLKEGQPFTSYVRMAHNGQFKTGINKGWIDIKGEQYATTETPGFIWKGTTKMFTARDMYIAGKGRLVVSLLSLLNLVNARGEQYNQGELLRWLGESVLYPTNLLPGERLRWFPIDATRARLTFHYNNLALFFICSFNEVGEITQLETSRYMDKRNVETWVIKLADYKEMNGIIVPAKFEVLWRLAKGDFAYAKFIMTKVEYDKHEQF